MKVKFLMIAEVEVDGPVTDTPEDSAQTILDNFRESVMVSQNYGITLYRVTPDDLAGMLAPALAQVEA